MPRHCLLIVLVMLTQPVLAAAQQLSALAELGRDLFFDVNLSRQRTQSCATCHAPSQAFSDLRDNITSRAVSLGDDQRSFGVRNTPTLSYVALTPEFHIDRTGAYRGGLFHDGRAHNLNDQAGQPIVNPLEMALTDAEMLAHRVGENPAYTSAISQLYGPDTVENPSQVQQAVSAAIASFEQTADFLPFDSKYDRYLRGEYTMSREEEHGRLLFFSSLVNCNSCHLVNKPEQETFTDYRFHNIGVPANPAVKQHGQGALPDLGLAHNPLVDDQLQAGKFKVPTLRNVAVTAPYMHNGVFADLHTAIEFYNKYIISDTLNPETGAPWRAPEVDANISRDLLSQGQPMDQYRIATLVAFLKTLTDRQYEHLLHD